MNELDVTFEAPAWQTLLESMEIGSTVSGVKLLTMLEQEPDEALEEVLDIMQSGSLRLDLTDLPLLGAAGEAATRLKQEEALVKEGLDGHGLEQEDPLRLYLEEVSRIDRSADEQVLAERCIGDVNLKEQLTDLGLVRVVELASKRTGRGVLLLDLIQEGSLGLWQAVNAFGGGDYGAFRDRFIENAMDMAILMQARSAGLGSRLRQALEDYRAVDERLLAELGRNASIEELAEALHMGIAETEAVSKMVRDAFLMNRTVQLAEDTLEEEEQAVEDTAYFQTRQRIAELMSDLTPEETELLSLRFGLNRTLPMSAEEVGAKLGLTARQVSEMEAKLLARLRSNA